jgi:mannose-6-phosphate isomerase-like protein (cupin superfamily)
VSKGKCIINYSKLDPDDRESVQLETFDQHFAPIRQWHQITNPFNEACHIIEIQYGEACNEKDIEKVEDYSETLSVKKV